MSQTRKMMSLLLKIKTPSKPTKKDSSGSDDRSNSDEEKSTPKKSKKATQENLGCTSLDYLSSLVCHVRNWCPISSASFQYVAVQGLRLRKSE